MNKYSFSIEPDCDVLNPRTNNDNFCHMALFHKKYDLGDPDQNFDSEKYNNWEEVQAMLEDDRDALLIVKVSMTDHSGLRIYAGEPRDAWDSGVVGFAWVSEDEIESEYGDLSQISIDKARNLIIAEIEEYDRYLSGDFYQADIKEDGEKIVSSCGGFNDEFEAEEWAKAEISALEKHDCPFVQLEFQFE